MLCEPIKVKLDEMVEVGEFSPVSPVDLAKPEFSVDGTKIVATVNQEDGHVSKQTQTTSVEANVLDEDLKAENVKKGVNIFGVDGTYVAPEKNIGPKKDPITANDTYNASDDGLDGYSSVVVNIPDPPEKTILPKQEPITENGTYVASVTDKTDGYLSVEVNVPAPPEKVLVDKTVTENGKTYNPADDNADGYSSVTVDVPVKPEKNIAPKSAPVVENGQYRASDDGLDGYTEFEVNVPIPPEKTLQEKTITVNGDYVAKEDENPTDGYSVVHVNVPSGKGNLVKFEPFVEKSEEHPGGMGLDPQNPDGLFYSIAPTPESGIDGYSEVRLSKLMYTKEKIVGSKESPCVLGEVVIDRDDFRTEPVGVDPDGRQIYKTTVKHRYFPESNQSEIMTDATMYVLAPKGEDPTTKLIPYTFGKEKPETALGFKYYAKDKGDYIGYEYVDLTGLTSENRKLGTSTRPVDLSRPYSTEEAEIIKQQNENETIYRVHLKRALEGNAVKLMPEADMYLSLPVATPDVIRMLQGRMLPDLSYTKNPLFISANVEGGIYQNMHLGTVDSNLDSTASQVYTWKNVQANNVIIDDLKVSKSQFGCALNEWDVKTMNVTVSNSENSSNGFAFLTTKKFDKLTINLKGQVINNNTLVLNGYTGADYSQMKDTSKDLFVTGDDQTDISLNKLTDLQLRTIDITPHVDIGQLFGPKTPFRSTFKTKIVLRSATLCNLTMGDNPFNIEDHPVEGVYVPDEMVDTYKAAAGWSTHPELIKPLSTYVPTV